MNYPQIKLLIVEDDPFQQELLLSYLKPYPFIHILDIVKTGDEFIQKATLHSDISAVLLDLHLGEGRGGLESYSILRFRGRNIPAILITGSVPEASYTYDLGIIDILEKPFTQIRFQQSIEKLCHHINYNRFLLNGGLYIPVYNQEIIQVTPSEVLFIESINRIVQVHTKEGVLETKIPLKVYEQYLQNHHFYMTHRSFLVNFRKISSIESNVIYFHQDSRTALITEEKIQEVKKLWETIQKTTEFL